MPWSERHSARPSTFIALIDVRGIRRSFGSEPRMRGSAGRIMIRPGQAIMIAWLTTAHAPLWEPAHERAPPQEGKPSTTQRSLGSDEHDHRTVTGTITGRLLARY